MTQKRDVSEMDIEAVKAAVLKQCPQARMVQWMVLWPDNLKRWGYQVEGTAWQRVEPKQSELEAWRLIYAKLKPTPAPPSSESEKRPESDDAEKCWKRAKAWLEWADTWPAGQKDVVIRSLARMISMALESSRAALHESKLPTPDIETEWECPPEPPRIEGKHRFMAGSCVDCGRPLDPICKANSNLPQHEDGKP